MAFSIKNILNLDDSNQDTNFSSPSKSGSSIESSQQVDSFVVGEHEEVVVTGDQEKSHVRDDCSEELDGPQKKRFRTSFTPHQLHVLEAAFSTNPYPDNESRQDLSCTLKINAARIMVWFQNRRARFRKSHHRGNHGGGNRINSSSAQMAGLPAAYREVLKRYVEAPANRLAHQLQPIMEAHPTSATDTSSSSSSSPAPALAGVPITVIAPLPVNTVAPNANLVNFAPTTPPPPLRVGVPPSNAALASAGPAASAAVSARSLVGVNVLPSPSMAASNLVPTSEPIQPVQPVQPAQLLNHTTSGVPVMPSSMFMPYTYSPFPFSMLYPPASSAFSWFPSVSPHAPATGTALNPLLSHEALSSDAVTTAPTTEDTRDTPGTPDGGIDSEATESAASDVSDSEASREREQA